VTARRALTLGTRGSPLALWQANAVAARIARHGGPQCEVTVVRTAGDRMPEAALSEHGGKGLFVKELEEALLAGTIDLAVHSSKDMSAILPAGLTIAASLPREDPRDALVLPAGREPVATLDEVAAALEAAPGATPVVGTSSVRRIAQLRQRWPTVRFDPVRGNLETRLRKLDRGEFTALVLAAAGLRRLGFEDRITFSLPVDVCVPAPGQGIVAVEARADDSRVHRAVEPIDDRTTARALVAERALVAALGAGCQMPLGALATPVGADELELVAVVVSRDGCRAARAAARGVMSAADALGARVGAQLLEGGAAAILADERAR
jgi:hydroxymethylbilane synthase